MEVANRYKLATKISWIEERGTFGNVVEKISCKEISAREGAHK
jgi:hypothetical protein